MAPRWTNKLVRSCSIGINERASDSSTPLMVAAERGHADVVKVLLNKGANIRHLRGRSLRPDSGRGPEAGCCGELLLKAGSDVEAMR